MSKTEKRKFARVHPARDQPIEVQIMGPGFLDVLHARTISEGGARIVVPHMFDGCDIDVEVDLIITLPEGRPFRARGLIKHKRESEDRAEFGLRFTALDLRDQMSVANYVAMRLSQGAEA